MMTLDFIIQAATSGAAGVSPWVYFVGGLGTFIAAIAGAYALVRKLGPDINNIQITSANKLVEMAESTAKMSKDQADNLLAQNKILDDRLTEYVRALGEATSRIDQLEETAGQVSELRHQVDSLREAVDHERLAKEKALRENADLKHRVEYLEQEVSRLSNGSA